MTRVHAGDGSLLAEYARERRLYLPSAAIPPLVKEAFISAEDKNFYTHNGVDPEGIGRALTVLVQGDKRAQGASTITQQVAKNFLLTNERSFDRKIREALLAFRIEAAYSKEKILELYLNEIYLGLGNYGVAAAALNYFDKSVNELTVSEVAYLAALPKAPNNYQPFTKHDRAVERRNWVIDRMVENGYVAKEDGEKAKLEPLGVNPRVLTPEQHRGRLFRRRSAARAERPLRREETLRGRPFGPHDARSQDAGHGAQGPGRRSRSVRRIEGLARRHPPYRPRRRLGRPAGRHPGARRRAALAAGRGARQPRTRPPASACSRRATRPATSTTDRVTGDPADRRDEVDAQADAAGR